MLTEAQKKLVEEHYDAFLHIAYGMFVNRAQYIEDDDIQHGVAVGLCQAAMNFDPSRGIKFSTYASKRVAGAVRDVVRKSNFLRSNRGGVYSICHRPEVNLDEMGWKGLDQGTYDDPQIPELTDHLILHLVENLRERAVMEERFKGLTFLQIARRLQIKENQAHYAYRRAVQAAVLSFNDMSMEERKRRFGIVA